jgi:hypothetical protein
LKHVSGKVVVVNSVVVDVNVGDGVIFLSFNYNIAFAVIEAVGER